MKSLTPTPVQRRDIIARGLYGTEKNTHIFEKWFAPGPRGRMQTLIKRYQLPKKSAADIGCCYGNNLIYFGEGSYGIEIDDSYAQFARSIGLSTYTRDFVRDDISDLPLVDAAISYAVIEHVESPHIALRKIHSLLKPGGIAIIYVPTLPLIPWLAKLPLIGSHFTGHMHGDHINAFTPSTIRFMVERAGFTDVTVTTGFSGIGRIFDLPLLNRLIDGIVVVGTKDSGWEYPQGSTRVAANTTEGFEYRN